MVCDLPSELALSWIKCWDLTRGSRNRLIYSSINDTPVRILLSLLNQVGHNMFNFGFYLQVQYICIFFVLQLIFSSLCFYWLPKQIVEASRNLRKKHWYKEIFITNLATETSPITRTCSMLIVEALVYEIF